MIIGVDGNDANVDKMVGVSVYTQKMLEYFARISSKNYRFRVFLKYKPLPSLPEETAYYKYVHVPAPAAWSKLFLPIHLFFKEKLNVFFSPAHYSPFFLASPLVVTIHDMAYEYYPKEFLQKDLYKLNHWTKQSINKSAHIITVSQSTKDDVLKFCSVSKNHISVVYNGFEKITSRQTDVLKRLKLKKDKYVLFVGTLQPRKNVDFLIRSFHQFAKEKDLYLVIVGKKGWLYEKIIEAGQKNKFVKDHVVFTGFLDDSDVTTLYQNALCFVLPSLYEGFGVPIIEAMSNGCPVITSNLSSLPEIGKDACLYIDPTNVNELVDALEKIFSNSLLRKELIQKGLVNVSRFSWEKSAAQTFDILKEHAL